MQSNDQCSVLFSDIRDFTEFTASQGDEQALRLSQLHREFASQTLKQLGFGHLIKTYGDGVMLRFDKPSQAVEAAIRLQHRANDHTQEVPSFPLLVGVGVHHGNVIEEDDDLFGLAVNLAKRLSDEARSGQIVVSQPVLDEIGQQFDTSTVVLGQREIKGMGEMTLYEVVWRKEALRLTSRDQALNLVLTTDDKLVIELGKKVRQELESIRSRIQEKRESSETPAMVQWMMKKSADWLPHLIDKALATLGIGIEHGLEDVQLWIEGDKMERLNIQIGKRKFDLAQMKDCGFDQEELKRFIHSVHNRQMKLNPATAIDRQNLEVAAFTKPHPPLPIGSSESKSPLLKRTLIELSQNTAARQWFSSLPVAKSLVKRFVAGETLNEALDAVESLNDRGILATLNFLGEETLSQNDAKRASEEYLRILSYIERSQLPATVSVKPSQLGMAFDSTLLENLLKSLVERAKTSATSVCVDMEGSEYTQTTLDLFKKMMLHGPASTVLQANLRRTAADLDDVIQWGAPIRLVKGAYLEAADIAFSKKQIVDDAFRWMIDRCLSSEARDKGVYTAIATHDERMLRYVCEKVASENIPENAYEFQMLYGIRWDLQQRLADAGHTVRVYVSYGTEWYPYFMRRLAERPANILFLLKNLFRS